MTGDRLDITPGSQGTGRRAGGQESGCTSAAILALGKWPVCTLGIPPPQGGAVQAGGLRYISIICLSHACLLPLVPLGLQGGHSACTQLPCSQIWGAGTVGASRAGGQWPGDSSGGRLRAGLSVPEGHLASVQPWAL